MDYIAGNDTMCAMENVAIGHATHPSGETGVSVILFSTPVRCAYHLCGSAPATRDIALLELENTVDHIDALFFTGGSAFGLDATAGVMQWLREQERGWPDLRKRVPIVPAAAIYDLKTTSHFYFPSAEEAYRACATAQKNNAVRGAIGAGVGARVGKCVSTMASMPGGVGQATSAIQDIFVHALVVLNSVGDVRDDKNNIIAGARSAAGDFLDGEKYALAGQANAVTSGENTTLVALMTNAAMTSAQLKRLAKMASAGIARAITPAFTPYDGDIIFAVSIGDKKATEMQLGVLAADAVRRAIVSVFE